MEMTASVFMGGWWFSIVAENVRAWRIFLTNRRNYRGAGAGQPLAPKVLAGLQGSAGGPVSIKNGLPKEAV
jgi:hypothetical protein